jgi:hypothetical protein
MLRQLEAAAVFLAIVSALFAGYLYLDVMHAKQIELLKTEIRLREEILDTDIKNKAVARVFYERIGEERELSKAEAARLRNVEEQLELKYKEQAMVQQRKMDLD